jgi:maltose-binding protein MalE
VERIPAFREDPILNGFIEEIIPIVVPMPYGPNYSDYALAFMAGVQEAMTSNKSIEDIADTMQEQVESIR